MLGQQTLQQTIQGLPIKSPIFGPAYSSRSGNLADQKCVNLYPEIVETKTGKEIGALYGAPGLDLKCTLGTGPIRRMHVANLGILSPGSSLPQPQRLLYVVSGTQLYSVDQNFHSTLISSGTGIGGPGGYLYSLNPNLPTFGPITLPFSPTNSDSFVTMADNGTDLAIFVGMSAVQCDGFGFINQPGSYNLYQSNGDDLSNWPALQFAQASVDPDNIKALMSIRNEVFVIKETDTEVWNNNGLANFAFGREQGPYIEAGCLAPNSVARSNETFYMLAKNRQGQGVVIRLVGYQFERVSTHAIERQIQSWPDPTDAVGYSYQQEGHTFYVLSSLSGDQTWVYDATVSAYAGVPMWHQRSAYSSLDGLFHRHWGNCHASFNNLNLVGDYRNGNIYAFDLNTFTDNGSQRNWLRSWRAIQPYSGRMMRFSSLTLDMQTGSPGINPSPPTNGSYSPNPQVMLRWSDDGGYTYSPQMFTATGPLGATSQRVKFNRLGSLRLAHGYDRIFELSGSDQMPVAIVGAMLE